MANNKYIVRRPIKDAASQVIGYEILYHGEDTLYGKADSGTALAKANEFAAADTIYNFLLENSGKALKGTLNFMTFTTTLLMKKVPRLFDPSDLVIQIDDSVIIHPLAMHFIQMFAKEGYKIAVNEFQFAPRYLSMMDEIDYIKLNFTTMSDASLRHVVEIANSMGKQCIATNVDTEELFQKAEDLGVFAKEGAAVAEKLASTAHSSSYLQSNFFRLMAAITKDEPNVEEIEEIISIDATMTYALLRVANSLAYSSRNKTTSVRQAITKMGLEQLKQWIYLLSVSNEEGEVDPFFEEFLKLSFTRANLCSELVSYVRGLPISKNEAYLMGMFSTLEYLIDAPMEEILQEVPVTEEIKDALLKKEGACGMLYEMVLAYENADWDRVNELTEKLGVAANLLTTLYFKSMEAANRVWDDINLQSRA